VHDSKKFCPLVREVAAEKYDIEKLYADKAHMVTEGTLTY
jgi:hypothetical protein